MNWIKNNIIWVMLGGVIILFLLNLSMIFFVDNENTRGTFGDQFGAVNALFSGLAFTGLIYTIILQRKDLELQRNDLRLQREELALNRKEMEDQTVEFEKQNETLRIQRFENTFFQMLSQFQEVVSGLTVTVRLSRVDTEFTGREIFRVLFERTTVYVDIPTENRSIQAFRGMRGALEKLGLDSYMKSDEPTYFDHYFRLLYRVLKFVNDTPLISRFEDKYIYTSMLRAILSRYELVWLYYNGLSEYGNEKLKPLIERYAMLKNIREDLLVDGVDIGHYAESAFEKTIPEE